MENLSLKKLLEFIDSLSLPTQQKLELLKLLEKAVAEIYIEAEKIAKEEQ